LSHVTNFGLSLFLQESTPADHSPAWLWSSLFGDRQEHPFSITTCQIYLKFPSETDEPPQNDIPARKQGIAGLACYALAHAHN